MKTKEKTKLIWRLSRLPEPKEVNDLIISGVITKEEGREILFSLETQDDRDKKSLEAEIEFLRKLVEKLSSRSQIVETIRDVYIPYKKYDWYYPYQTWVNSATTATADYKNGLSVSNTAGGSSLLMSVGSSSPQAFSAIKTF